MNTPDEKKAFQRTVKIYCGAAAGVLAATLTDAIKNGGNPDSVSAINRASAALQAFFPQDVATYVVALWTLLILVGLGLFLCWLRKPATPEQSTMLGLSLFAILSTISPYSTPSAGPGSNAVTVHPQPQASVRLMPIATAYAAEPSNDAATETYYVELEPAKPALDGKPLNIHIYNSRETRELARLRTAIGTIAKIATPSGSYVLYIDGKCCARKRYPITIRDQAYQGLKVVISPSGVPLGLQRLVRPDLGDSTVLSPAQAEAIAHKYLVRHGR